MSIYNLIKIKINREGMTEETHNMLDVFLFAGRITQEEYKELIELGKE